MVGSAIVRGSISLSASKYFSLENCVTLFILLAFFPCSTHAQFSQRFAPTVPTTYAAGGANPYVVALSDVNGDGKPDLIVATATSTSVKISYLPGNGNGTFGAPHTAITLPANYSFPVATADFNHDSHLDLVVMTGCDDNGSCQQLIVLLGDGYGTFHPQPAISCSGCSDSQVGTADVNRDGELDLVFSTSNELIVLPGTGNGKFKSAIISTGITGNVGAWSGGLVVGDFNGDGVLDVVVSDGAGICEIAFGNGNGTFRKEGSLNCGFTGQLAAADFRKDGKLDLIYSDYFNLFNYGDEYVPLYIARGNGDGTFGTPKEITPGMLTDQVLIGDFNGDGRPDILGVNAGSPSISVLLSNNTGTFGTPLNFRTPRVNVALAVDVNGDGKTDVLLSLSNGVGVLFAQSGGTFHAAKSLEMFSVLVAPPSAPVDVNHDGIPDILMITNEDSDYRDGGFVQGVLPVLSSNGVALSSFGSFVPNFSDVHSVGVGNFNKDSNLDAAIIGDFGGPPENIAVSLGDGKGNFSPVAFDYPTTSATTFAVGDFNGDGLSDLALLVGDAVEVELGKGGNTFSSPVGYAVGSNPVAITVRDVNGDGKQDLVVVNKGADSVSVLLGNGNGTFQSQKVFQVGASPVAVALADFNRDGKVDLAVANKNNVSVLIGTGTGSFGAAKTFAAGSGLQSIAAADLRQNRLTDLLVGESNGNLAILGGLGNGSFAAPVQYAAQGASFIDVADFNGDGAPDVVVPGGSQFSNAVSVLYNQGGTRVTLNSSAGTVIAGSTVKLTAKVAATVAGAGNPTGSVVFYDGSKIIGTGTLSSGTATLTTAKLTQGNHTFKAIYSGSTNFNTHESPSITVTVKP